ncbi:sensor histidine kinase [Actinomyces timonensis]|uniref:sensor histidine kinase n=1 Tax=Actinomyces timonensis TaxID=1288391 RepID=UPI0002D9EB5B|nr:ATP-binding protein [Actinomyces timonensis]
MSRTDARSGGAARPAGEVGAARAARALGGARATADGTLAAALRRFLAPTRLTTWAPRRRTHLLCLACAGLITLVELVTLSGLSSIPGGPGPWRPLLVVASGVGLALVSPWPLLGSALALLSVGVDSAVIPVTVSTLDPLLPLKVWLCASVLVSRGFNRVVAYGMVVIGSLMAVIPAWPRPGEPSALSQHVYAGILGAACLVVAELLRQPRMQAEAASQRYEEDLERQRLLVISELHDTVVRDLTQAVMVAEQARLARGPGAPMDPELAAMTASVRAAVEQLRSSLRALGSAGGGSGLDVLASSAPRPLAEVVADARRLLAARGIVLETAGLEALEDSALSPGLRQQLARVLGELVANMAKHAAPGPARLVVERDRRSLEAMASNAALPADAADGGAGGAMGPAVSSGLGLVGARRRVEALGGTLDVSRTRDRFTAVLSVPLV